MNKKKIIIIVLGIIVVLVIGGLLIFKNDEKQIDYFNLTEGEMNEILKCEARFPENFLHKKYNNYSEIIGSASNKEEAEALLKEHYNEKLVSTEMIEENEYSYEYIATTVYNEEMNSYKHIIFKKDVVDYEEGKVYTRDIDIINKIYDFEQFFKYKDYRGSSVLGTTIEEDDNYITYNAYIILTIYEDFLNKNKIEYNHYIVKIDKNTNNVETSIDKIRKLDYYKLSEHLDNIEARYIDSYQEDYDKMKKYYVSTKYTDITKEELIELYNTSEQFPEDFVQFHILDKVDYVLPLNNPTEEEAEAYLSNIFGDGYDYNLSALEGRDFEVHQYQKWNGEEIIDVKDILVWEDNHYDAVNDYFTSNEMYYQKEILKAKLYLNRKDNVKYLGAYLAHNYGKNIYVSYYIENQDNKITLKADVSLIETYNSNLDTETIDIMEAEL